MINEASRGANANFKNNAIVTINHIAIKMESYVFSDDHKPFVHIRS